MHNDKQKGGKTNDYADYAASSFSINASTPTSDDDADDTAWISGAIKSSKKKSRAKATTPRESPQQGKSPSVYASMDDVKFDAFGRPMLNDDSDIGLFGTIQLALVGWPISDYKMNTFAFVVAVFLVPFALLTRLVTVGSTTFMSGVYSGINNKMLVTFTILLALLCYNVVEANSSKINTMPSLYLTDHSNSNKLDVKQYEWCSDTGTNRFVTNDEKRLRDIDCEIYEHQSSCRGRKCSVTKDRPSGDTKPRPQAHNSLQGCIVHT